MHLRLNGVHRLPPPPGAFRASSRPLPRGRAVRGDWPDGRARGQRQDFGRVFTLTAERLSAPVELCRWGRLHRPPTMDALTKHLPDNAPSLRDSAFIRVKEWEDPAVIHPGDYTLYASRWPLSETRPAATAQRSARRLRLRNATAHPYPRGAPSYSHNPNIHS